MSNGKKSSTTNTESEKPSAKGQQSTAASAQADKVIGQETAQGFRGTEVDPTPNENYTVAGVTSGAPTPETDVANAREAREVTGLGLSALEAEAKAKEDEAKRSKK